VRLGITSVVEAETGLAAALAESGAAVVSVGPEAASLEQVFLELTR
jgi:hypothetical protein